MQAHTQYSTEQLTNVLKELVAEAGQGVTLMEFCRRAEISATPVYRLFGSWTELRRQAGLSPRGGKPVASRYRAEDIVDLVLDMYAEFGNDVSFQLFSERTGITRAVVHHHFGSWTTLRRSAGLACRPPRARVLTNEELLEELDRLRQHFGRFPKPQEIESRSRYCWRTFVKRFGSRKQMMDQLLNWRVRCEMARRRKAKAAAETAYCKDLPSYREVADSC